MRLLQGRVQKLEKAAPLLSCFGGRGRASSSAAGWGSGRLGEARGHRGEPRAWEHRALRRVGSGRARRASQLPRWFSLEKRTVVSHLGQEFGPKGKKGGLNSTTAQCIWKLIELYGTDNFVNIKLTKKSSFFLHF